MAVPGRGPSPCPPAALPSRDWRADALGRQFCTWFFPCPGGWRPAGPGCGLGCSPPHTCLVSGRAPEPTVLEAQWSGLCPEQICGAGPGRGRSRRRPQVCGPRGAPGPGSPGAEGRGGVLGRARSGCRNGVAEGWRLSIGCRLQADGTHPALPHFWARGLGAVWMGTSVPRDTLPENKPGTQRKDQRRVTWRGRADGGRARGHPKAGRGLQGKGRRAGWWQAGDKGGRLRACDGSGGRVQDKQAPEGWVR